MQNHFFYHTHSCNMVTYEEPRLLIDASIDWIKNTSGKEQKINYALQPPTKANSFQRFQEQPLRLLVQQRRPFLS